MDSPRNRFSLAPYHHTEPHMHEDKNDDLKTWTREQIEALRRKFHSLENSIQDRLVRLECREDEAQMNEAKFAHIQDRMDRLEALVIEQQGWLEKLEHDLTADKQPAEEQDCLEEPPVRTLAERDYWREWFTANPWALQKPADMGWIRWFELHHMLTPPLYWLEHFQSLKQDLQNLMGQPAEEQSCPEESPVREFRLDLGPLPLCLQEVIVNALESYISAREQPAKEHGCPEKPAPSDFAIQKAAGVWCRPELGHKVMDVELATGIAHVIDEINQPNLGLATTAQLIDEIRARIEVDGKLQYKTVGPEPSPEEAYIRKAVGQPWFWDRFTQPTEPTQDPSLLTIQQEGKELFRITPEEGAALLTSIKKFFLR